MQRLKDAPGGLERWNQLNNETARLVAVDGARWRAKPCSRRASASRRAAATAIDGALRDAGEVGVGTGAVVAGGVWLMGVLLRSRARREEAMLEGRFGDGFRAYRERTGQFLPRMSRRAG